MSAQVIEFPRAAPMTDAELFEALGLLDPIEESPIYATRDQRRARYARLGRDCEARRARQAFEVVT